MLVRALAGSPRSAWCPQGSAVWEPASVSLCFRPKCGRVVWLSLVRLVYLLIEAFLTPRLLCVVLL